ncbi:Cacna1c [Symbiodinium sp. KB8]|nr:Cacna1c [Symbiodinium sp. KB8]
MSPGSSRLQTASSTCTSQQLALQHHHHSQHSSSPLAITCPRGHKTHGQAIPLTAMPLIVDSVKRDLTAVVEWGRQKMQEGDYEKAAQHFGMALDRLSLAKAAFEESVEKLRAEFDRVQQHAQDLASICVQDGNGQTPIADLTAMACADVAKLGDETAQPMHEEMVIAEIDTCTTNALEMSENVLDVVNCGHIGWQVLEYVFVAFYTFEFLAKVWMYGWSWYWCGPERAWNLFDIACLLVMYVDVAVATMLLLQGRDSSDAEAISSLNLMKIFRLARLARLIRALRFQVFHELKLIVLGVFSGLRVICWAIVLLVVLVYSIGVGMRNFVGEGPQESGVEFEEFETVAAAMFTCFRCFTDGCSAYDGTPLSERLREAYGGPFIVGYIFVTMLVTVGVFNLIMAVFIENVMSSQFARKQTEIADTALGMETKIKDRIIRKLGLKRSSFRLSPDLKTRSEGLDEVLQVGGRNISRDEFDMWLRDPDFVRVLDEASIDVSAQVGLFDVLDADAGGELSVRELVTGLMSLRGPVTKGDVIGMSLKIRYLVSMMEASQISFAI